MKSKQFTIRAAQLDLARQMESLEFIRCFIDLLAGNHYNTLFLYLEWRIRTQIVDLGEGNAYSAEELRNIVNYAKERGIKVIPGVAGLGHCELLLSQPEFAHLGELREGSKGRFQGKKNHFDLCPSLPEVKELLENYFTEVHEIFASEYMHVGCDEAWNIAYCSLCRASGDDYQNEGRILERHLLFCHSVVSKKLNCRMMIWDDMLENYPLLLDSLPRDIVLVNWQYQANVTANLSHRPGGISRCDLVDYYEKLGFDYLIAPNLLEWDNISSFSDYVAERHPLGALLTSWEKKYTLMYKYFPMIAAAGLLWHGEKLPIAQAIRQFWPGCSQQLETALTCCLTNMKSVLISADQILKVPLFHWPNADLRNMELLLSSLEAAAPEFSTPLAEVIWNEILDHCRWNKLSLQQQLDGFAKISGGGGNFPSCHIPALREVASSQARSMAEHRDAVAAAQYLQMVDNLSLSIKELEENIRRGNWLRCQLACPDPYAAEEIIISLGRDEHWEEIWHGRLKCNLHFLYDVYLPLPESAVWQKIRLSAYGYGGQGVAYMSLMQNGEELVPSRIIAVDGYVEHPEYLLLNNSNYCFLGYQGYLPGIRDRKLAERISTVEMELKTLKDANPLIYQ